MYKIKLLVITNILILIVAILLTSELFSYRNYIEDNYSYTGEWRFMGKMNAVDGLLDIYSESNENKEFVISEQEAVDIASTVYRSVYGEEHIRDTYCEVVLYEDPENKRSSRKYYVVSRKRGEMPDEWKYDSAVTVVINALNGEILAIRPEE